ncbi:DUF6377 domain-containing protein [Sphingobacterium sp. MYb382]|uniref:DUF6377 domain-containing protein n=1 Tax=Sphingobacterium sp. MYb382 TaxID=2745278 RepID=UPI0030A5145F
MWRLILVLCTVLTSFSLFAQTKDEVKAVEYRLQDLLKKKDFFQKKRVDEIKRLKDHAEKNPANTLKYFKDNYALFTNYKKFQNDSALTYILKCKEIAKQLPDSLNILVNLDLSLVYSGTGRYIEAEDLLKSIPRKNIPQGLIASYYDMYSAFYSHYGQSNNRDNFYKKSEIYRDSLLHVLDKSTFDYQLPYAIRILFEGDRNQAKTLLHGLLENNSDDLEKRAVICYFLGLLYKQDKNIQLQKYYYTLSVNADIELANKDNASFQDLALTYYELGDVDFSFLLIEKAIQDAMYCNVRYRIIEGTSFYPIINASHQKEINSQNAKLRFNLYLISFLVIILIVGLVVIVKQIKKLNAIKNELFQTNSKLMDLNLQMSKNNNDLSEANHIKEAYIAQFFDMCSSYIEKIDSLRKTVIKKATSNQFDGMIEQLKSPKLIDKEVTELYHNFDRIFLNLYPSFVDDFNKLLKDDEHIYPKKGELLNTELRIFALIRLGIDDSIKIASFLRYSLRTVYNYRTKVRNKASVSRADFEDFVKLIAKIDR